MDKKTALTLIKAAGSNQELINEIVKNLDADVREEIEKEIKKSADSKDTGAQELIIKTLATISERLTTLEKSAHGNQGGNESGNNKEEDKGGGNQEVTEKEAIEKALADENYDVPEKHTAAVMEALAKREADKL